MLRNHYMTSARHNACAQLRADDPSAWLVILSQIACRRCPAGGGFVSIRMQEGSRPSSAQLRPASPIVISRFRGCSGVRYQQW